MEIEKIKSIIEAILFAAGRQVNIKELIISLELSKDDLENIIVSMQEDYKTQNRGIEIIKVDDGYQLCTKKELYEYIYPILDKRSKPNLSNAALETLAIIAYNSRVTRAEIESIRGVNADACIYKLLEYGLIQEAGKADLPELPRYKLDENQQIVIDELIENTEVENDLQEENFSEFSKPEREEECEKDKCNKKEI